MLSAIPVSQFIKTSVLPRVPKLDVILHQTKVPSNLGRVGSKTNLLKRISHSLSSDSGIMRSWIVLAVTVSRWNRSHKWDVFMSRFWRHVNTWGRPGRGRSDVVQVCWKRFFRRPILLTWHRICLAATDGGTLACNFPIERSRSTGVNFVTAIKLCVVFHSKV